MTDASPAVISALYNYDDAGQLISTTLRCSQADWEVTVPLGWNGYAVTYDHLCFHLSRVPKSGQIPHEFHTHTPELLANEQVRAYETDTKHQ